jgi:hypothetical protein
LDLVGGGKVFLPVFVKGKIESFFISAQGIGERVGRLLAGRRLGPGVAHFRTRAFELGRPGRCGSRSLCELRQRLVAPLPIRVDPLLRDGHSVGVREEIVEGAAHLGEAVLVGGRHDAVVPLHRVAQRPRAEVGAADEGDALRGRAAVVAMAWVIGRIAVEDVGLGMKRHVAALEYA